MVRPPKTRFVGMEPGYTVFKPAGIPIPQADPVELPLDAFEAIRLVDLEGLDQDEAAALMNISRPTLSRILERGRRAMADAVVNGKALVIEGGNVTMVRRGRCGYCGTETIQGRPGIGRHRCRKGRS